MNQSTPYRRSLEGMTVGITISESTDSRDKGYSMAEVNQFTVRLAEMLLGEGACVVSGHRWKPGGVIAAMHRWAVHYHSDGGPQILNFLPWPDEPGLTKAEQQDVADVLEIRETGLPPDLKHLENQRDLKDPWLRARALTHMRRQIVATVDAQICLGGKTLGSSGRFPGTVEEVYLLTQSERPVYLSGLIGGATRQMIDAIRHPEKFNEDLCSTREDVREAFDRHRQTDSAENSDPDAQLDPDALRAHFTQNLTMQRLCDPNRLTPAENDALCDAATTEEVLALTLRGLRRLGRQ